MLTGRGRKEEEGGNKKSFFFKLPIPRLRLFLFSSSPFSHFPCRAPPLLLPPQKGLFFSSSSTILLAAARPAQAGGREVGGNKRRAEPIALQRGCRCQRGPPPPSPSTDSSGERPFSKAPLRHCPDRPTPHRQRRFLLSSLARARSWSRYWGEGGGKEEVLAGLGCVGGEEESVALAFHSPAPPLVFLTFPRWRAHYRVRETLFSAIRTLSFLSSFFGLEVP